MKRLSLYFTAPYELEIREEDLPPLASDQVLVQTVLSAVSPGTEMLVYRGQTPPGMAIDDTIGALAGEFNYPLKYGYAAVGRVVALGSEVEAAWQDRVVFAFQPHESHFLANPDDLITVPDAITPETAAFLPNMETAVSFLMDGQPTIGEQVAVFGQGIVGLLTAALLAPLPLASLVTLDYYPLRRDWSRRLGTHAALDPAQPDLLDQLRFYLQGDRPYMGADLAYEVSGNPQALDQAVAITGFNGRILVGSWYGQKRASLDLGGRFHRSHIRLISSQVSHIAPQWRGRWSKDRRRQQAWAMLSRHSLASLITHRFPFDHASRAFQLLDQAPQETIQVVLTYDES